MLKYAVSDIIIRRGSSESFPGSKVSSSRRHGKMAIQMLVSENSPASVYPPFNTTAVGGVSELIINGIILLFRKPDQYCRFPAAYKRS